MKNKSVISDLVEYFKSDQWQELMRLLTQEEEEIYHIHVWVENQVEMESLIRLFEKYFFKKNLQLDRAIDAVGLGFKNALAIHGIHPYDPRRLLNRPTFDMLFRYNSDVVLKPADPKYGEEGKNIMAWGKQYMENWLKQFDFKILGPWEEKLIREYFESAHWKKYIRVADDKSYVHAHVNVEINFDPWFLKIFGKDALEQIGWRVANAISCVYNTPKGYLGKISFLTEHPQDILEISWMYNSDVVIRPAEVEFLGYLLDDGDPAIDAISKSSTDEMLTKYEYLKLNDEQIKEILSKV
jgi:hypothetical protein